MNKLQKSLLLILALMALGQTAWAQTSVSNETELRNALNDISVTYINVSADFNIEGTDELVVSSHKDLNLVGYELKCYGNHFRVASGGSLVIYSEYNGKIIGKRDVDGCAIYIDSGGTCTIQSGTVTAASNGSITGTNNCEAKDAVKVFPS